MIVSRLTPRVRTLIVALLCCCPGGLLQAQEARPTPEASASAPAPSADGKTETAETAPDPQMRDGVPVKRDTRAQLPPFLADSYIGASIAYIGYNFSERQLEPGFRSTTLSVPRLAARIDLFGHRFNEYVSMQATYMRPAAYVTYRDINGDSSPHHVWMNFGAVLVQGRMPVNDRVSAYAEGGFGIVSRRGFDSPDGTPVVRHAHYSSAVLGGGLIYHATASWDLVAGVTYIPQRATYRQPATVLVSTGARFNTRPPSPESLAAIERAGNIFPANVVQLELLAGGGGGGVNKFFSSKVPIFWNGNVEVDRGMAVHYERNVLHTKKVFALDVGTSVSFWRSRADQDKFATFSLYPLLRFTVLRTKPADVYVMYSFAGPTYITKIVIDKEGTGGNFTFQDFMGAGVFLGQNRNTSIGLKITHYSNGNLFIDNPGLKIPLTLTLGYAF